MVRVDIEAITVKVDRVARWIAVTAACGPWSRLLTGQYRIWLSAEKLWKLGKRKKNKCPHFYSFYFIITTWIIYLQDHKNCESECRSLNFDQGAKNKQEAEGRIHVCGSLLVIFLEWNCSKFWDFLCMSTPFYQPISSSRHIGILQIQYYFNNNLCRDQEKTKYVHEVS